MAAKKWQHFSLSFVTRTPLLTAPWDMTAHMMVDERAGHSPWWPPKSIPSPPMGMMPPRVFSV